MKPSFVVLSDLHAHPRASFSKGDDLNNTRLQRSLHVLDASLAKANELKVPWLFAGDLVHTAGYALNVVLAALTRVMSRYPDMLKLAVWGNHDARGVGGRIVLEQTVWATLSHAVEGLIVLDPSDPLNRGFVKRPAYSPLSFSGAGAQPRADLLTYAEPSDVGLYHGTVRGSVGPNGFVFEHGMEPTELLSRHRVAIVGDIHHAQQIKAPGGKAILIPGSPEHHDFGDMGEHGWWIMSVPSAPDEDPTVEFVPGGSPEFRTVDTPRQIKDDGHFYRVRSVPPGEALPENATAIGPTPTTVEVRDTLRGVSQPEAVLQAWLKESPPEGELAEYLPAGLDLLASVPTVQLRPVRITRLLLRNFCSYREQVFEVRDGTWLVLGRGRDYPSNGAGKSTLFEAIFWLLFGRMTKELTGDEVIQRGQSTCEVTAALLDADHHELVVARQMLAGEPKHEEAQS